MSVKFTSSNGGTVEMLGNRRMIVTDTNERKLNEDASVKSHSSWLDPAQIDTLREYFLHERDQELGRWRWPECPEYVVYPDGTSRTVVKESNGRTMIVSLHDRKVMTTYLDSYVGAARAYDAAHPEPKPWHDAKPGEVWVLDTQYGEVALQVLADGAFDNKDYYFDNDDTSIKAGRRIWPEVSDGA